MTEAAKPGPSAGAKLLIDLGPLLVFFGVNAWFDDLILATGSFMVAITASILVSLIKYRHVSPLLWFSAVMVLVLGGVTVWLHDETFIKIKPTIYYVFVAALLLFGLATGRNLLKTLLGTVYPGLSERGWQIFTRNWVLFFLLMAVVNEAVWRTTTTDFWIAFKIWFFLPAVFIFGLGNIPMLMRHGFSIEDAKEEPPLPPTE
jgi:intracellular septation protein